MSQSTPATNKMPVGRLILIVVVAIIGAIFIFSNWQGAEFRILGWGPWTLPMWIWLAVAFVLGMVFGGAIRSLTRKVRGKSSKHD